MASSDSENSPTAPAERWVRVPAAKVFDRARELVLVGRDGLLRCLPAESAPLARAVLDFLFVPRTRAELVAHVGECAGEPLEETAVLDELLALLTAAGAIIRPVEASAPPAPPAALVPRIRARVVLGVTGAVATVGTASLVYALQRRGFEVRVAATRRALRFFGRDGIEALTHRAVAASMRGRDPSAPVPHLDLAGWADIVVVCPASATTLSRLAAGDFSDVVAATALSTRAPVLLVPAMNPAMWAAPAVARNIERLREDGFSIAHPGLGPEVAEPPADRRPLVGAAPPPDVVVDLCHALIDLARRERGGDGRGGDGRGGDGRGGDGRGGDGRGAEAQDREARGLEAQDWDALYARAPTEALPFFSERPEPELLEAIERVVPSRALLLDIGTGPGTVALEAVRRGYRVVATDVSEAALESARARAGEAGPLFVLDDITETRLRMQFAAAVDRGCFHLLTPEKRARYPRAVAGLLARGGVLLLQADAPEAARERGTARPTREDIATLFNQWFELVEERPTSFLGIRPARSEARLWLLRRTS